jgi:hypothetical protein
MLCFSYYTSCRLSTNDCNSRHPSHNCRLTGYPWLSLPVHTIPCNSKSKSKTRYNRWSVDQSVLVSSHIWELRRHFYCQTVAVLLTWDALSDGRTGLTFDAVKIISTCHLYLKFYMSGSFRIPVIYSFTCNSRLCMYNIYTRPLRVQAWHNRSCHNLCSACYNGWIVTWTVLRLTAAPAEGNSLYRFESNRTWNTVSNSSSIVARIFVA